MSELGYYVSYQGKWHLSVNLDQVKHAIDAPFDQYRKIIQAMGSRILRRGDINDTTLAVQL